MSRIQQQNGYILLPVVLFITVIATIAFLINNDTTINGNITAGEIEAEKGQQVAEAGLAHAIWGAQNSGCAGDMSMTTVTGSLMKVPPMTMTRMAADTMTGITL